MIGSKFVVVAAVLVFGWGHLCECQVFFGGECLDVDTVKNFDVKKFMGTWYEYQRYPSDLEKTSKCSMDTYELRDGGDVTVLKSQYNIISKSYVERLGTASDVQKGRMLMQFKDSAAASRSRFWVLDTDYTSYSVLYACTPITDHYHTKMIWIMTRDRKPGPQTVLKAFKVLAKNRIDSSYLLETDQTGCMRRSGIIDKVMEFA